MKLKLYNQLKESGKIQEGLTAEDFSEEQLLKLAVNMPEKEGVKSTPTQLSNDEFKEMIANVFDSKVKELGIDKIDAKYMKLPGVDINETELKAKGISEQRIKNIKMLKFLKMVFQNKGTSFMIEKDNPIVLETEIYNKLSVNPDYKLALNSEASGSVGGYTVPVEFFNRVSMLLNEYGVFRRNARPANMNSQTATMPKLSTQPAGSYISTDITAVPESNPTFAQVTFTRRDYGFITGISQVLLQDTGVDLVALLAELVADDFARNEDTQGFRGTGSPITGVFAAITDTNYITTTSGTNPNTLTITDLIGLTTKPKSKALMNAKWYFHREILGIILALKDTANRPLFNLSDQLLILSTKSLLGYPYELSDALNDDTNTASTPIIAFGDLSRAATFAERQALEVAYSDTATVGSNSAFEKRLAFFRFITSHDIQIEQETAMAKIVTHA